MNFFFDFDGRLQYISGYLMRYGRIYTTFFRPETMNNMLTPAKKWRITSPLAFEGHCTAITAVSILVLVLIGWLDYITGYEFGFFIFYFIPVAIAAWYCGRMPRSGHGRSQRHLLVSFRPQYPSPLLEGLLHLWEMFMRLLSFLTTALTVSRIRQLVLNEERMLAELLAARSQLANLKCDTDS